MKHYNTGNQWMRFFLTLLVFCFVYPAKPEFNPLHKLPEAAQSKLLSHDEIGKLIEAAALKHNVAPALVKSIMAAESAFQSDAVSSKGALGLMQVMPETAQMMGLDASIPEQNVEAGAKYLAALVDRYRKKRDWLRHAIAAYNAGPGNVDRYRGVPPFRETRAYVVRVMAFLRSYGGSVNSIALVVRKDGRPQHKVF